jgi:hypothetical protein
MSALRILGAVSLDRAGRLLGGMAISIAIFFVTGEVLARSLGLVDRLNGYARQLFQQGPSLELPYVLRPGVEAVSGGARVHVNDLGLRGPDIAVAPAPGVVRVLVLGDSVVFGQGVDDDATFPAVLARRLTETWHRPVETLNAGVQGYDTVAETAFLEGPGLAFGPHGVVVGMSLNDYDPAPSYDPTGVLTRHAAATDRGPLARSEFLLLLRWLRTWARGELTTQMLARASAEPAALAHLVALEHQRFYRDPDPVLWARLRGGLETLRDTAATHGLWLSIAIFPESWQIGVASPDMTPQRRLLALCAELGIACVDLAPAFGATSGTLFLDVQHPNARGLALAGDTIAASFGK